LISIFETAIVSEDNMSGETARPERRIDLDWIRIIAFGLLILYHIGMLFVPWDFHVKSVHILPGLEPLMLVLNPWRLSLLFLVSGAATRFMSMKLDPRALFAARAARLLPPIVFGMLVIVPPQSYFQVVDWGYSGSFVDFYFKQYLGLPEKFCQAGHCLILPTWNHLWFVVYLFVYTAILALVLAIAPALLRAAERRVAPLLSGAGLLILPTLLLAVYLVALFPIFPQTHALVGDWYNHALYGTVFLFGYLFALDEGVAGATQRLRWPALAVALFAYANFMIWWALRQDGAPPSEALSLYAGCAYAAYQWCSIVAILGFGRRWLNRDAPARRYLTDAVFPFYILHQTAIIATEYAIRDLGLPAWAEAAVVIAATVASCIFAYEIVRRVWWLRPWFGLKREPRSRVHMRRPLGGPLSAQRTLSDGV
jgi:glucan biosynthesis protein C